MKYLSLIVFILIVLCGCRNRENTYVHSESKKIETVRVVSQAEEEFLDSTRIGVAGIYKIDFKKFRTEDSVYVVIKFYEKENSNWNLKQNLQLTKDGVLGCEIEIADFNNDKLNDFTFKSAVAARGANEIRTLLIFNKELGELIPIKNSEEFPNLRYNKDLDCIDAFRVYSGCQSVFAKIENDSLIEFASVEIFDNRIKVDIIDEKGNTRTIRDEKYGSKETYKRFKNYSPLAEYEGEY